MDIIVIFYFADLYIYIKKIKIKKKNLFLWEEPLLIQKPEYNGYMYVKEFFFILQNHYDQF
jgi:hypothetical protein